MPPHELPEQITWGGVKISTMNKHCFSLLNQTVIDRSSMSPISELIFGRGFIWISISLLHTKSHGDSSYPSLDSQSRLICSA